VKPGVIPQTSPPAVTSAAGPGTTVSPVHTTAFSTGAVILLVYVFLRFSMINELVVRSIGFPTYINYLLAPAVIMFAVWSGRLPSVLVARPGALITAFSVWLAVTTPFSLWIADSTTLLFEYLRASFLLYLGIACLVDTPLLFRRFTAALALATTLILVTSFTAAQDTERFQLLYGSMLANPNDLATHLLFLLPFCVFVLLDRKRTSPLWILALATTLVLIGVVLRTGSRSGFVVLLIVLFLIWLHVSPKFKVLFAAGAIVAGGLSLMVLDPVVLQRYRLLWSAPQETLTQEEVDQDAVDAVKGATASSEQRRFLIERGLKEALLHPLFGTGPGQFINAEGEQFREEGRRAPWVGTHNTYLEVAAEMGLPGLFLYAGVLLVCFLKLNRIRKLTRRRPELRWLHNMSACLLLSLIGYSISTVFCHLAYKMYIPVLAGLTVAVMRFAESIAAQAQAQVSPQAAYAGNGDPVRPNTGIGSRPRQPRRASFR
jgi:O-antigen ligase